MRAVINAAHEPTAVPAPSDEAASFHTALPGYQPTPVHRLDSVLGVEAVYVKDESSRLGLPAFKILGASWAAERLLRNEPHVHTLVTASAGNHGRAVAHVAALRNLACRVYLPKRSLSVRREAITGEGAEVIVVDGSYEDAVRAAQLAAPEDRVALLGDVGDGGTADWVIDGYATLFAETASQVAYDFILVPVGVGSLAAAAARHGSQVGALIVGIEPANAACLGASLAIGAPTTVRTPGTTMAGLDCADVSPAAWPTLYRGIAGTIAVTDEEAAAAMQELAASRITCGESGASTVAGLRALLNDERCDKLRKYLGITPQASVLLIATEGNTGSRRCEPVLGVGV